MNLVSNNSLFEAEIRHFLDSAQLYHFCRRFNGNILDLGSGAGFPGAVLSILGIPKMFLIESNTKKCNFLATLKKETNSNFNIINSRIENLNYVDTSIIMSRALSSTKNLINLLRASLTDEKLLVIIGKINDSHMTSNGGPTQPFIKIVHSAQKKFTEEDDCASYVTEIESYNFSDFSSSIKILSAFCKISILS